jgi:hypothetical protein
MTGCPVESRPSFPWSALGWLVIAGVLVASALAEKNPHPAIAALLPFFIAASALIQREKRFVAELSEESLEVREPVNLSLPYTHMEALRARRRGDPDPRRPGKPAYPITVLHTAGILSIPKRLTLPSDDVYRFLYGCFTPGGSRDVGPRLQQHLEEQIALFGADKVWSYRARAFLGTRALSGGLATFIWPAVLTGLVWIGLTLAGGRYVIWGPVGFLVLSIAGCLALLSWSASRAQARAIKDWRRSSVVISPAGLALVQGDIQGEMKWRELKKVSYKSSRGSFQASDSPGLGIVLSLEGADVVVADIYDRPLYAIYERILNYWQ